MKYFTLVLLLLASLISYAQEDYTVTITDTFGCSKEIKFVAYEKAISVMRGCDGSDVIQTESAIALKLEDGRYRCVDYGKIKLKVDAHAYWYLEDELIEMNSDSLVLDKGYMNGGGIYEARHEFYEILHIISEELKSKIRV